MHGWCWDSCCGEVERAGEVKDGHIKIKHSHTIHQRERREREMMKERRKGR
jgi:hypothetical protein